MINKEPNVIPDNTIVCLTDHAGSYSDIPYIVEPLKGKVKRDWFSKHAYHCLPLVIGNQYGFAIKSAVSFTAIWNGEEGPENLSISILPDENNITTPIQQINSHFGSGIITIQNRFNFRTPPGVNMMVMPPPNIFYKNFQSMSAVIETDNLRRDFTFNFKIIEPNVRVNIKAGDIISTVIPIPRFYVDSYELKNAPELFTDEVIKEELNELVLFEKERSGPDLSKPHQAGKLYHNGTDASGNKFYKHQKSLK
jgi:hypothetical protein